MYRRLATVVVPKLLAQHRMASMTFQFRKEIPVYYPDRQMEMQRINEQRKSQLIAETQPSKSLPKDFYYKVLGLRRQASAYQIKTAYYTLAKLFHPDASNTPQETKRFQDISNAYQVLSDEKKRKQYDDYGTVSENASEQTKREPAGCSASSSCTSPGFPFRKQTQNSPSIPFIDNQTNLTQGNFKIELDFVEAALGSRKTVDMQFHKKCPTCLGKILRPIASKKKELCNRCGGTGQLTRGTTVTVCTQCAGTRYISRNNCDTCESRGIIVETLKMPVAIPPGARTGDLITVTNPQTQQPIHCRIHVKFSKDWKRVNNDIHSERYITISQAVLGCDFMINGIYEDIKVKIEPGTESHTQVVLKGKGIRTIDSVGDHIITFKVCIPRQLTMKQRQLITALAKAENSTVNEFK